MEIKIEKGKKEDLPVLMELIRELAEYERELDQVTNTIEMMEVDGFGANPVFDFILAKKDEEVIGAAIYYYRYSTWKGKRLYLEDLIVTGSYRGNGAGKKLFDEVIAIGKKENCTGMMWQVLDWNEPAIEFYKKYNTEFDAGWLNCHLQFTS
jgi:GNAT superfamily N-acetyltransferase